MVCILLNFEIDRSKIGERRDLSYSWALRNGSTWTCARRGCGAQVIVFVQLECGRECIKVTNEISERIGRNDTKLTTHPRSQKRTDPTNLWISSVVRTTWSCSLQRKGHILHNHVYMSQDALLSHFLTLVCPIAFTACFTAPLSTKQR